MTTMQVLSRYMRACSFDPVLQAQAGQVNAEQPTRVFGIDLASLGNWVLKLSDAPQPSRSLGDNTILLMMQ